jgi:hypothetical protein
VTDRLIDTSPEPTPLCAIVPEPFDPRSSPYYFPHDPNRSLTQRFETPQPPQPPLKRPGFAT